MARMKSSSSSEASLGEGFRVKGRVHGDGDLRLSGEVEGDVSVTGVFTVEAPGTVSGKVHASEVEVAGTLTGNIEARGAVRIVAGARVKGDVQSAGLSLEEGAQFDGRLDAEFDLPGELTGGGDSNKRRARGGR